MLAFEIHLNGKRLCTAGIGEPGALSAILTWVRGEPRKEAKKTDDFASIRVGGLINRTEEHAALRLTPCLLGPNFPFIGEPNPAFSFESLVAL